MTDWRSTARALMWLTGILVALLGLALGHITTKAEIVDELAENYVPRNEINARLQNIERTLSRIETKVDDR